MIKTCLAIAMLYRHGKLVERYAKLLERDNELVADYNLLVDKHNDLVRQYNAQTDKNRELREGVEFASNVALAAFKRIPVEYQDELKNDIDFLAIVTKEGA